MIGWHVSIPGIPASHTAYAECGEDALRDALFYWGLSFAPPGTCVTRADDDGTSSHAYPPTTSGANP